MTGDAWKNTGNPNARNERKRRPFACFTKAKGEISMNSIPLKHLDLRSFYGNVSQPRMKTFPLHDKSKSFHVALSFPPM